MADRIDHEKIAYVDGILNSIGYYRKEVQNAERLIKKCEEDLQREYETGGVHSPTIMSSEEAKYQKGTRIYRNRVEWLIGEKSMYETQRDHFLKVLEKYNVFISKLSPEEHDMIYLKYERHESYDAIAEQMIMSRDSVRRRVRQILMKW